MNRKEAYALDNQVVDPFYGSQGEDEGVFGSESGYCYCTPSDAYTCAANMNMELAQLKRNCLEYSSASKAENIINLKKYLNANFRDIANPKKLDWIKAYRVGAGVGLQEAKKIADKEWY
jgi:hypothetical protein